MHTNMPYARVFTVTTVLNFGVVIRAGVGMKNSTTNPHKCNRPPAPTDLPLFTDSF